MKKEWIFNIALVILLFSLAFCLKVIGNLSSNKDIYESKIELLERRVINKQEELNKERLFKESVLDSLNILGNEYAKLEYKDSISRIKYIETLKKLKYDLNSMSGSELSNLMIKTYEEATNTDTTTLF